MNNRMNVFSGGDEHSELQDVRLPGAQLQLQRPLGSTLCGACQPPLQPCYLALLPPGSVWGLAV